MYTTSPKLKLITLAIAISCLPVVLNAQNPFGIDENDTTTTRDIYGYDSRREAKTYDYKGYTNAVLTQMHKNSFDGNDVYGYTLEQKLKDQYDAKVDPSLRFKDQIAVGNCTGFLIAPDIMVTAAHCISTDNHEIVDGKVVSHKSNRDKYGEFDYMDWKWVFDYTNDIKMVKKKNARGQDYYVATIPSSNQFKVKKVLKSKMDWSNLEDYAIIQLDHETSREPFRIRTGAKVAKGDNLAMIGAPAGLPLKLSDGAKVTMNSGVNWFGTNLDAFGGNSGGPVYNTGGSGMIEGILVRGRIDMGAKGYYLDTATNLVKETKYKNEDAENVFDDYGFAIDLMSTEVQRITNIPLNLKVRAVYNNFSYAIRNNDQDRFDNFLIYSWAYTMDTADFVKDELAGADPLGVLALKKNKTEMFKTFVDEGMDCNLKLDNGRTMLYYAITNDNNEAVNYILKEGYNLDQMDDYGNTPLIWAIQSYNNSALESLLKNGANLSTRDSYGDQPLHRAIKSGSMSMVQTLVQNGADIKSESSEGWHAIKLARKEKQKTIKKWLKKAKKGKV